MAKQTDPVRSDADPNAMPLQAAIDTILAALGPVSGEETLRVGDAIGRVAKQAIRAAIDVPPFRASAMDGYAFRFDDVSGAGTQLQISGRSLAGHPGADTIPAGTCQRITTGARVPDEADTVVQQEDVHLQSDGSIVINELPQRGEHVRHAGSDTPAKAILVDCDHLLNGADLAVCAAHGVSHLPVRRVLRVGVLSTGDELIESGEIRARGQIYDANRILLTSMLARPAVDVVDLGIVEDTPQALAERVSAASDLDAIVTTGGVSVGDADHVRDVLGSEGHIRLWKIAMKPGRPLAFGRLENGQAWFGLPGNPVSAAITAMKVLQPALARMAGHVYTPPPVLRARLSSPVRKRPGRVEFQRGVLDCGDGFNHTVVSVGAQDSHRLQSLQRANCLIELPVDCAGVEAGELVRVIPVSV